MDYITSALFCVYSDLLNKNPAILEIQKLAVVLEWELRLKLPFFQNLKSNYFSISFQFLNFHTSISPPTTHDWT